MAGELEKQTKGTFNSDTEQHYRTDPEKKPYRYVQRVNMIKRFCNNWQF